MSVFANANAGVIIIWGKDVRVVYMLYGAGDSGTVTVDSDSSDWFFLACFDLRVSAASGLAALHAASSFCDASLYGYGFQIPRQSVDHES